MARFLKSVFLAGMVVLAAPVFADSAQAPAAAVTAPVDELIMYNFVLGKGVKIDPAKLTAESARDYLPQMEEAMAMYDHFLSTGLDPFTALYDTYQEVLGVLQAELQAQAAAKQGIK